MDTLLQDLRFGARQLIKSPGFTIVALLAMSLGIGASTAIFSVVDGVLLKPLAYAQPERLVILWEQAVTMETSVSYPNFVDLRDRQTTFDRFTAFRRESFNLVGVGEPERLQGRMVSSDFFPAFGVPLQLGRDFTAVDDKPGADPVAVLSYDFWQRRFGGDPAVIGSKLSLNNRAFTVVGVAGKDFRFGTGTDIYAPLGLWADNYQERGSHPGLYIVGRLKPGATVDQARSDLDGIFGALGEQFPKTNEGRRSHMESLFDNVVEDVRVSLLVLLGVVGLVLVIACVNVANLLLARGASRNREIALRAALGAGRVRIIRQLLTESVLLSLCGGALGMLLAIWGTDLLVSAVPDGIPRIEEVHVDLGVLAFASVLSLLTGVIFGLAPAFAAAKVDVNDVLKEGERGSTARTGRLRSALVVSEVAIALVVLVCAGLMIRSMQNLEQARLGFDATDLLTLQMAMTVTPEDAPKAEQFIDQLEARLRAIPGVTSASVSNGLPFAGAVEDSFYIDKDQVGTPDGEKMAVAYITTPGYLRTLGITLLRGRFFDEHDLAGTARVAVVDESFVEKYFGGEDAVGRFLYNDSNWPETEIIGVVGHVKHYGIDGAVPVDPQVYLPLSQAPPQAMPFVGRRLSVVVRTASDPTAAASEVRDAIHALDGNQPVFNIRTMEQTVASSLANRRFAMSLLSVFAGLALLLSAVGIYGVMATSMAHRRHEMGIRMALGAERNHVLALVLKQGMLLASIGLAFGLVAAAISSRVISSLLYGVSPTDPVTFLVVLAVLEVSALAACLIPAFRASRIDPMRALHHD